MSFTLMPSFAFEWIESCIQLSSFNLKKYSNIHVFFLGWFFFTKIFTLLNSYIHAHGSTWPQVVEAVLQRRSKWFAWGVHGVKKGHEVLGKKWSYVWLGVKVGNFLIGIKVGNSMYCLCSIQFRNFNLFKRYHHYIFHINFIFHNYLV